MAQTETRPIDPGFVYGGVGWGPLDNQGPPGFVPSDAELDYLKEIEAARERYRLEHLHDKTS